MILEIFLIYICIVIFEHGRRCQHAFLTRYIKKYGEGENAEEMQQNAFGAECGFLTSAAALVWMAVLLLQ